MLLHTRNIFRDLDSLILIIITSMLLNAAQFLNISVNFLTPPAHYQIPTSMNFFDMALVRAMRPNAKTDLNRPIAVAYSNRP